MGLFEKFNSANIKELTDKAVESILQNKEKFAKSYSESGFKEKLQKYGKKLGATVTYPVVLLYSALKTDTVETKYKVLIASCLGYFILPADLIPDVIGGVGFADDAAAITACLKSVSHVLTPSTRKEAKERIHKIFGEVDCSIMEKADNNISEND